MSGLSLTPKATGRGFESRYQPLQKQLGVKLPTNHLFQTRKNRSIVHWLQPFYKLYHQSTWRSE